MCGICGVASLSHPLDPAVLRAVPAMALALRHRGPDGEGFFSDAFVGLAHRRLAIIDREGGHQPMANEDESCWVVFNGEIYNHRDLRRELESRGHRFRTTSDTEVILHGYEEWGTACVERLEGMFAFVLYDQNACELFLARDRLGKKPLFYGVFDGTLHFASEIKALMRSPAWEGAINGSVMEEYLSLGYILAPRTIYKHVSKLEPGCYLLVNRCGTVSRRYWDVERFDEETRDTETILGELDGLLGEMVRCRLESEVPLGAFLSGGIDSGLVVSYMSDQGAGPPETASVGFEASDHNELAAAASTAAWLGTRHHQALISLDAAAMLDRVVEAFDEPFADPSAVPTFAVSGAARQFVTVALSGDGGDEIFSGYDWRYVPHILEARVRPLVSGAVTKRLLAACGARWPRARGLPRALRLRNVLENLGRDPASAYYWDLCFLKPPEARRLLGLDPQRVHEGAAFAKVTGTYDSCPSNDPLQRAQYSDLKIYLPNDVLVKVDRMSMAHGLEVRCPLLDRRVAEFGFRIPRARKMPHLEGKHLLRALARRRLPPAIVNLPKHGFSAPIAEWLGGACANQFRDEVLGPTSFVRGWLDRAMLESQFETHRSGRNDHSYLLWAVWMLERWGRIAQPQVAAPTMVLA